MPADYPQTVAEVLTPPVRFRRETLQAVRRLKRSFAWRGNAEERQLKLQNVHADLCRIYGKRTTLTFGVMDGGCSGRSYYSPSLDQIVLIGKPSVLTLLHEWSHVIYGPSEQQACRWSIQLFAQGFPRSFSRLSPERHMLRAQVPPQ